MIKSELEIVNYVTKQLIDWQIWGESRAEGREQTKFSRNGRPSSTELN